MRDNSDSSKILKKKLEHTFIEWIKWITYINTHLLQQQKNQKHLSNKNKATIQYMHQATNTD